MTIRELSEVTYPDFVGIINQWNVLPGAYSTINKWIQFGFITRESRILQIACTTGFQSREIAALTGCSGKAFDLSEWAIRNANFNKQKYTPEIDIEYFVQDGYTYFPDEKFSHVIVGAGLQFFPDPLRMKLASIRFLREGGLLLASPFYVHTSIPERLIEKARGIFGITVTTAGYKEVMSLYEDLEIIYEDRCSEVVCETDYEIAQYCQNTTDRAVRMLNLENNSEAFDVIYNRLKSIKIMSNELRPYQSYTVLVLRYRSDVYPNRFVELF